MTWCNSEACRGSIWTSACRPFLTGPWSLCQEAGLRRCSYRSFGILRRRRPGASDPDLPAPGRLGQWPEPVACFQDSCPARCFPSASFPWSLCAISCLSSFSPTPFSSRAYIRTSSSATVSGHSWDFYLVLMRTRSGIFACMALCRLGFVLCPGPPWCRWNTSAFTGWLLSPGFVVLFADEFFRTLRLCRRRDRPCYPLRKQTYSICSYFATFQILPTSPFRASSRSSSRTNESAPRKLVSLRNKLTRSHLRGSSLPRGIPCILLYRNSI